MCLNIIPINYTLIMLRHLFNQAHLINYDVVNFCVYIIFLLVFCLQLVMKSE